MTKERSKFITPLQAARLANCCATFVCNRVRAGAFRSERDTAGHIHIDLESFLKWNELYQVRRHINPSVAETVGA